MRRTPGFTLIELMIVIVIIGVLAAITIPNFTAMTTRSKEAGVKANAHTLQVAAEDFAAQNDAVYATDFTTALPNGQLMADLLPAALRNPFGNNPMDDTAPDEDGEVGYDTTGMAGIGYVITGWGKGGVPCITVTNGH